jgi:hypothetical protein
MTQTALNASGPAGPKRRHEPLNDRLDGMLQIERRAEAAVPGRAEVAQVPIVVVAIVVVALSAWGIQRSNKRRRDFVPSPVALNDPDTNSMRVDMDPIATPTEQTAEIIEDRQAYDAADDLLDPHNPRHDEWVREHPDMETDAERAADQDDEKSH